MTEQDLNKLGSTLWTIADELRGSMNADDFRDYMLSFLFLRYLSNNYETAVEKALGSDYPKLEADDKRTPLSVWYAQNPDDVADFEKDMRRKVHYVIQPEYLWSSISELARTQNDDLLNTLEKVINASEHFEKGKRQNRLLDENVKKIVETYQHRKEEERYSRCVSMDEIEKNDFNLNISRYVSIAQDEVEIDLKVVNSDLIDIEKSIAGSLNQHNQFLKELGLPHLPIPKHQAETLI